MTAISKAWVNVADGAVDPDSPLDTVLMTALRDDAIHLREWLGASFYAGAVQDHRHDGVDSALVPVGPNALRNGSFEADEIGWTFVDFTGGSHAVSNTVRQHGAKAISFTSTVLANGGGEATSNEFVPCADVVDHLFDLWYWASVANVSAKAEVIWYDADKGQISVSTIVTDTTTPTTPTRVRVSIASPANAAFYRIKLTGGIPGSGAATGTIYFDGIKVSDWSMVQAFIEADAVGQSELKTTTASGSTSVPSGASATVALTGGSYACVTWGADNGGVLFGGDNTAAGTLGFFNIDAANRSFHRDERYVQASPPYRFGPTFVFLLIDSLGEIVNIEVGFDPPWAYNGPTDIRPHRRVGNRGFRRVATYDGLTLREVLASGNDSLIRAVAKGEVAREIIEREITLAYKDSDKDIVPHHWVFNPASYFVGLTIVMLEPGTSLMGRLEHIASESQAREVRDLIRRGYLNIDNNPIALPSAPAGVTVLPANWKLTG